MALLHRDGWVKNRGNEALHSKNSPVLSGAWPSHSDKWRTYLTWSLPISPVLSSLIKESVAEKTSPVLLPFRRLKLQSSMSNSKVKHPDGLTELTQHGCPTEGPAPYSNILAYLLHEQGCNEARILEELHPFAS